MKVYCKNIVAICLSVLLLVANVAFADSDYEQAQKLREAGEILPLESILQKLHTSHPGKILEVELENKHDLLIYEIEILDDEGKVWKIKVNAKTGVQLQHKKDD